MDDDILIEGARTLAENLDDFRGLAIEREAPSVVVGLLLDAATAAWDAFNELGGVVTAQSETRQRVIEWLNSARSPSEHRTFGEFFRHAPQVIESIVDALLDDDAVLADVVAAAGRDRVLKAAGGTFYGKTKDGRDMWVSFGEASVAEPPPASVDADPKMISAVNPDAPPDLRDFAHPVSEGQ